MKIEKLSKVEDFGPNLLVTSQVLQIQLTNRVDPGGARISDWLYFRKGWRTSCFCYRNLAVFACKPSRKKPRRDAA
jgi:hypothetical protein